MKTDLSQSNISFSFLAGSSEFLNTIINNITSCVVLLDREMRLRAYNNPLKSIFSNKENEDLLYRRCGEVIGCAYQIDEQQECGKTSHCPECELREAALTSYTENVAIYKENIIRPFYNNRMQKVEKKLHFSTRLFSFKKEKYIILLVEDVTKLTE